MPDIFDLLGSLVGMNRDPGWSPQGVPPPRGLEPPGPLAAVLGPGAQIGSMLAAPLGDRLAQFADVPGPPRSPGEVIERLMQVAGGAGRLGEAAGIMATAPLFARQAQLANAPGLANIPFPGVAGNVAASVAPLSLLPGGRQVADALGVPAPTMGYGDVVGPAYAAAAQQGGGLSGLGAALEQLASTWEHTPEVIPATKFAAANVVNPLTYLPGGKGVEAMGGPAGALIGRPAVAANDALNLPLRAAQRAWGSDFAQAHLGTALSDYSKGVRASRFGEDMLRAIGGALDAARLQNPAILGESLQEPGLQAASVLSGIAREPTTDAELGARNAAQAADAATAAKDAIAARLGGTPTAGAAVGAGERTAPGAAAPAAPAVLDPATVVAEHPLRWWNNRAEATYSTAKVAYEAALGHPPAPNADIPLTSVRQILDPQDHADSMLESVLANIRSEGVRRGEVGLETAVQQRRTSFLRGLGGDIGGQTSARTGELTFEPDTIGQVDFAMKRLQGRGLLPAGDTPRLAVTLRWAEDNYGDFFPAPSADAAKQDKYLWAAIQAHMDRAAGKVPEAAADVAAPAVADVAAAGGPPTLAAGPSSPGAPVPAAGPAAAAAPVPGPGAAGEALAGARAEVPGAPAGNAPVVSPAAVPAPPLRPGELPPQTGSAAEEALIQREQYLSEVARQMEQRFPTAPGVPDPARDAIQAELASLRTQRQGPPVARGEIPPPPEPFAPPSPMPEGPLGGMAEVPPEPFAPGTTMAQDPALLRRVADARKTEAIVRQESNDPAEITAAIAERKAAEEAAAQDLGTALPADFGISAMRAPQFAAARQALADYVEPGRMGEAMAYGRHLGVAMDKIVPTLDSARALRTESGLGPEASLRDVAQALKAQGSEGAGVAQQLLKDWGSDLLTGNLQHIVHEKTMADYVKSLGLDVNRFAGPGFVKDLSAAWRAQALLSPAFHLKNVADSVIRSLVDSGKAGFVEGGRPWHPDELVALVKDAYQQTAQHDMNTALSPQLRVWSAIQGLPVYDTMFAAKNPTLDAALAALTPEQRTTALASLTPLERALMQAETTLAAPAAIAEATGPMETGGWLGKVPGLRDVTAFNLKLTMGVEQSARGAKFLDAYQEAIQAGTPKAEAYQQAIQKANDLFFDYQGNLSDIDRVLRHVMAFHIFATRNLKWWAPVLASNPILIKALAGYEDWSNQQAEQGGYTANRRFAESIKIPMAEGLGGKIAEMLFSRQGQLFWNPVVYLSIAEQALTTPQEYRDEPPLGIALNKARSIGLGLAPWVDLPLTTLGTYGARAPQGLTSVDSLVNSAAQTALGRPTELPWQTAQRARWPGLAAPASLDIAVRQRLGEMSLEARPDFVAASPYQPIAPEYIQAMVEGDKNPLYREAARGLGRERLIGTVAGKVVGGGPAFESQTQAQMAEALGNPPGRDATPQERKRYRDQRLAAVTPEQVPLISAKREIMQSNLNEPGSRAAGQPEESMPAYIARVWPGASPARQHAMLQNADPAMREAIVQYLGNRVHLQVPGRG